MNYHLYFHDDFDGMSSSAILLDFFRTRGDGITSFNPLNFEPNLRKFWAERKFKQPSVMVDFLYHPDFTWWFDHHPTSFINEAWRNNYKNDDTHYFNPKHKSCASAVLFHLKDRYKYKPPANIGELVLAAEIIDSAAYKSAAQLVRLKNPAIILALTLDAIRPKDIKKEKSFSRFVIQLLSENSIKNILKSPRFKKGLILVKKEMAKAIDRFDSLSEIKDKVVLIKPTEILSNLHFVGYYLHPEINFSVIIDFNKDNKIFKLRVGKNPWRARGRVHIGKILSKYGGGGHDDAGGLERKTKEEILKVADEVVEYLNTHG